MARPSLESLAGIEDELGRIDELHVRLARDIRWCDVVTIVEYCIEPDEVDVGAAVLEVGLDTVVDVARALIATCFDERSREHTSKSERDEAVEDTRLPVGQMTGQAVSLWGLAPDEAWAMTIPEWWDATESFIRANTPRNQSTAGTPLSIAEAERLRKIGADAPETFTLAPATTTESE